jgi:hypothetical protein
LTEATTAFVWSVTWPAMLPVETCDVVVLTANNQRTASKTVLLRPLEYGM